MLVEFSVQSLSYRAIDPENAHQVILKYKSHYFLINLANHFQPLGAFLNEKFLSFQAGQQQKFLKEAANDFYGQAHGKILSK